MSESSGSVSATGVARTAALISILTKSGQTLISDHLQPNDEVSDVYGHWKSIGAAAPLGTHHDAIVFPVSPSVSLAGPVAYVAMANIEMLAVAPGTLRVEGGGAADGSDVPDGVAANEMDDEEVARVDETFRQFRNDLRQGD